MRKTLTLVLCLLSFFQVQAQNRYYVANNNGTYQAITIDETHQMEFDAEQRLIAIKLVDGAVSTFATAFIKLRCMVRRGFCVLAPEGVSWITSKDATGRIFSSPLR